MTVIVTGASTGMGREFVRLLDREEQPEEIWVIARSKEKLEKLQSEVKARLRVLPLDLTKREDIGEYAGKLAEEKPEVSYFVHAAGFGKFGHTDVIDPDDEAGMVELNDRASVLMTRATMPYLSKNAHVVLLGSLSAFQPVPYMNVYAASKAFVLSYARGLNAELSPRGVRVTCVCPGWVDTPFFDRAETAQKDAVTYFNKVYAPETVVAQAYRDAKKGREKSICGFPVKMQVFLVKLLPHRLVMRIWLRQQGHRG